MHCIVYPTREGLKYASSTKKTTDTRRAIVYFISRNMGSVGVVEGEGFVMLMATLNPRYKGSSKKHVSAVFRDTNVEVKGKSL